MMQGEGSNGSGNTDRNSADSDSGSKPPSIKRAKNKSKVWDKVTWFTRRSRSRRSLAASGNASHPTDGQGSATNEDVDFVDLSPSDSTTNSSPVHSLSLNGSSSSSDSDLFERHGTIYRKRSKLYPNSEVVEQSCLRPSVARALFLHLENAREVGGREIVQHPWQLKGKSPSFPKYEERADELDVREVISRTVSMPGRIVTPSSNCHCVACCSCSPGDRLMGLCPAYSRRCTSIASLDTGLTNLEYSLDYPMCAYMEKDLQSVGKDYQCEDAIPEPSTSAEQYKTNSLPAYYSQSLQKKCKACGKFIHIPLISISCDNKDKIVSLPCPKVDFNGIECAPVADDGEMRAPSTSADCHGNVYDAENVSGHSNPVNANSKFDFVLPVVLGGADEMCHCRHSRELRALGNEPFSDPPMDPVISKYIEPTEDDREKLESDAVKPSEFKVRLKLMREWFSEFDNEQKNMMLKELLAECDLPQIHWLSLEMEPKLHAGCPPNCRDRLSWLPESVALYILAFLDPVSLCRASGVCVSWFALANDTALWRKFSCQPKWRLSRAGEQKQLLQHMRADGTVEWKKVFSERFKLRNNWLKGKCNVRTFEGHAQGISCVQFDDTRIVSGSSDKTIKVWNIRTNSPWAVQTLVGHSGTVRCLHLDGNRLVSGSTDRTIKVWDLSTQQSWSSIACKVTMIGHTDTVRCLKVGDDKVISGSYDKTLKVWDIRTGLCRMTLRGHDAAVLCVQFDGTKIVSGSCDKTIKVWTFEGQCGVTLHGHHDAVTCLQFDSTRIISGSLDCNLKFWDIHTGQCVNTIDWKASEGHTGVVRCLQADSWRVVSASDDRTLKVWSLETAQRLVTLRNHSDGVTCLQFNDYIIVSGSYDKTVKLWDFSCC